MPGQSRFRKPLYLPSPEEIKEKCSEIRRTWTPKEKRDRRLWANPEPVSVLTTAGFPLRPARPLLD
jgi:hypothetical protein